MTNSKKDQNLKKNQESSSRKRNQPKKRKRRESKKEAPAQVLAVEVPAVLLPRTRLLPNLMLREERDTNKEDRKTHVKGETAEINVKESRSPDKKEEIKENLEMRFDMTIGRGTETRR